MANPSPQRKGWLRDWQAGLLAAVYTGAQPGAAALAANTALTGILVGTPVVPALAVDSIVISNLVANGDFLLATNTGGNSQSYLWIDTSAGTLNLYGAGAAVAVISSTVLEVEDGIILALGNDQDDAFVHRVATLAANTALTGVLIGTPVSQALAANSLMISNVTASGDAAIYVNTGTNSEQLLFADGSASILYFGQTGWAANFLNGMAKVTLGTVSAFGTNEGTNVIVFRSGTAPAGAITTASGLFASATVLRKIIADGTVSDVQT